METGEVHGEGTPPGGVPFGRGRRGNVGRPRGAILYGLRWARIEAGMNTRELAEASGVSHATINFLENGRRGARPETLYALARALEVEEEALLREADAES